jgi:hypothetical protein
MGGNRGEGIQIVFHYEAVSVRSLTSQANTRKTVWFFILMEITGKNTLHIAFFDCYTDPVTPRHYHKGRRVLDRNTLPQQVLELLITRNTGGSSEPARSLECNKRKVERRKVWAREQELAELGKFMCTNIQFYQFHVQCCEFNDIIA